MKLPTVPGQMATVLVALAVTESRPSQISVGKETSVPPPATELIAPARKADKNASAPRHMSMVGIELVGIELAWINLAGYRGLAEPRSSTPPLPPHRNPAHHLR